jgi:hypothetical protein
VIVTQSPFAICVPLKHCGSSEPKYRLSSIFYLTSTVKILVPKPLGPLDFWEKQPGFSELHNACVFEDSGTVLRNKERLKSQAKAINASGEAKHTGISPRLRRVAELQA